MADEDEISRLEYPEGGLVCWVPRYAKRDMPDDPRARSLVVGLLDCQLEGPRPEYIGRLRNMTGRYESATSVCCVNQAGHHMELWWSSSEGSRKLYRYGADYESAADTFAIYEATNPLRREGSLVILNPVEFRIYWNDGNEGTYKRVLKRATVSDRAMERLMPLAAKHVLIKGWLEQEHRPVRRKGILELTQFLQGADFKGLLQDLFSLQVDGTNLNSDKVEIAINNISLPLRRLTQMGMSDAARHVFLEQDRDRVRSQILPVLLTFKVTLQSAQGQFEQRTLYDWLQRVLYYDKNFGVAGTKTYVIKHWLGVPYPEEHFYEVEASLRVAGLDVALPFGKALGRFKNKAKEVGGRTASRILKQVKKIGGKWAEGIDEKKVKKVIFDKVGDKIDDILSAHAGAKILEGAITIRPRDGSWEATYIVLAAAAGAGTGGAQAGVELLTAKGYCTTGVEWKPEAFTGMFTILPGLLATDKSGTRMDKQMIWLLDGQGTAPRTMLVFDDVETDASDMDIGWGEGIIMNLDPDNVERFTMPDAPMFDYTLEYREDADVFFQLGSATVREPARRMLRVFAANELALLRDRYSGVAIEGFADRIGQRWYNQKLSESRAANVRQALEDCLGDDLEATVDTHGHGEEVLAALGDSFGFPDGKANEQWRRVFVVMNSVVAATMGNSETVKGRKGKKGKKDTG